MLASIRDQKGQGNAALFVRARNATGQFWDFTASSWISPETNACRVALTEYQDADTRESRYQASVLPPTGDVVLEYVKGSDNSVIGEETTQLAAVHAATLGRMVLDPVANTMTFYWPDGTVMAVLNLSKATTAVPGYVARNPA